MVRTLVRWMQGVRCSREQLWALAIASVCSGCEGPLSALAPASEDAREIATLFWWMTFGAALIWGAVMALALYAIRSSGHERRKMQQLVIGGGAVVPTIVLTVLLAFGLGKVPKLFASGDRDGPVIRVSAEQWWWRVSYTMPDGRRFELGNEIRLPVDRRMFVEVVSPDVIHSLWVPALAGKIDAIPGRVNEWALEASDTGTYWGVCAEYCGQSHAKMMFVVVAMEADEFEAWARAQHEPAQPGGRESRGASSFREHGCGACHTVRGTESDGVIGPDLTHVGSRESVGAGILPNDEHGFRTWLARVHQLKPGVHMPSFEMLGAEELGVLATYLDGLR